MSKSEWIQQQYALSDEKDIALFTSQLNTKVSVTKQVIAPIAAMSIYEIAQLMPDEDNLLIENTYRGSYASIRENIEKGSLQDVAQSIKNLLKSAISPQGKAVLQGVLDGILSYMANPPMQDTQVWLSLAEIAGFDEVFTDEVVKALL